jgi:tape measure domain-containing protein
MPSVDVGLTITAINNTSNAIKGVGADVKNLGENAQATSNRLKAIQVVIAGILLEKTVEWTKKVVEAAAATQNLDLRMAGFAGSAQKAHAIWSDLAATFAGSPLNMDTITQSWIKLRSVVSSNDQATTIIKSVANAILALGGSDENINNVTSAFQRMFASGSASSREYKGILQQTGITLGDLAKVAHTTSTAIETELRRGFMNAEQFTEMFVKAANSRFGFFAQNLKNSIGGAYQLIFNTLSKDISDLGAKTDVNARVTVFFQNLAHAIDDVMGSINQSQIDKFWDWLRKIEPLIQNTVTSLIHIAQALLTIGSAIATLLAKMPQEATEYGIIGYMLLGKKGAALGAMLGTLQHNQIGMNAATAPNVDSGGLTGWIKQQDANAQAWFNRHGLNWLNASVDQFIAANNGKQGPQNFMDMVFGKGWDSAPKGKSIFGTQQDWDNAKKALDDLIKKMGTDSSGVASKGISAQLADAIKAAQALTDQLNDTLKTTGDRVAEINAQTSGDELGAMMLQTRIQGDGIVKSIDSAIKAEAALKIHTSANLAIVAALRHEKQLVNDAIDAAIEKEKRVYALQQQQFQLQQMLQQMQNHFAAVQLDLGANTSPLFNMFQGTAAGQASLQVMQQTEQLREQLVSITNQQIGLEEQLNNVAADPVKVNAINSTIRSLDELKASTQNALQSLSVEGQMTKQLWKDLANTMENDIANGLTGLIEGTMTLGDVMRQVFGDMISLGIKFLLQLVEIQLFGQLAQQMSLASIAPTAMAAQALWAPAAIAASIATFGGADATGVAAYMAAMATSIVPFAQGGVPGLPGNSIVTGPTLFGMAGEAGDEAIMPLTRIGGKLGVRAEGGGGNHYHFHSADPESNVKFFMEHLPLIEAGLMHRQRLNHT